MKGTEIYAALFELSDPELVAALVKLGKKAHLGHGSRRLTSDFARLLIVQIGPLVLVEVPA